MLKNMLSKRLNKNNIKISSLFVATLFLFSVSVLALSAAIYYNSHAEAITTANLRSRVDLKRYRITYNDLKAGTPVDGNPAVRKVTLFTMAGGDQILSMVTNTTTAFVIPGVENTGVDSLIAEINGVQVSDANLITLPGLAEPNFYNGKGLDTQFLFFDESQPTNVVMTVRSGDSTTSLDSLVSGQLDIYVTIVN